MISKYKEVILYLFFGGLTTIINIAVYNFLYYFAHIGNVPSNIAAWIISVLFAYVTNRLWVFESKNKSMLKEAASFFGCRIATGVLDLAVMFFTVDILMLPAGIMKLVSNVIVIVLNYVASKLWIFSKQN